MDSQSENINNDVPKASTVTEELPEHFYDSDIASVNENDFLSDNEPPKDKV